MSNAIKRGALIVFEGCDRSGKTTQCKQLVDVLTSEGHNVSFMRFPERATAIGRVISDYLEKKCDLEDHAVHLLFTANRWEAVPRMLELLRNGTTLIVDRYSFSGVAYSAAKPKLSMDWCVSAEVGLPKPDAVLFLNLSSEAAAKRGSYGEERYEQTKFQIEVDHNYKLMNRDWKIIDANKNIEELHIEIKEIVTKIINECEQTSVQTLWTDSSTRPCTHKCRKADD